MTLHTFVTQVIISNCVEFKPKANKLILHSFKINRRNRKKSEKNRIVIHM